MQKIINTLKGMYGNNNARNIFKDHIYYLRFPYFKNFEKNFQINFTFPITFLTGINGTGKSSLLHALYGSVSGKSISDFWFNTQMDPIKEKNERNCLIASFKTRITHTQVEILKSRVFRKEASSDYWEPARPQKSYNMLPLPANANPEEANNTRWKLQEREVYYMDFRYHLSAYDKYFYFATKPNSITFKTKQDYLRSKARLLKKAFDSQKKVTYRSRNTTNPISFSDKALKILNEILGKKYLSAQILEHNLYSKELEKGFALKYTLDDKTYSEAYAGSGETAVAKMVYDFLNLKENSLVLLDEPETSLHPKAQKGLIKFILNQIIEKKLQVVISTHSPDILEGMPKEAIKLLYENLDNN